MTTLKNLIKKVQPGIDSEKISKKDIKYFLDNDPTKQKHLSKFMTFTKIKNQKIKNETIRDYFDRYNELGKLTGKYGFQLEPLKEYLNKNSFQDFKNYIEDIEKTIDDKIKLEIDHIIPQAKKGKNIYSNLIVSCKECNLGKGDTLLKDLKW